MQSLSKIPIFYVPSLRSVPLLPVRSQSALKERVNVEIPTGSKISAVPNVLLDTPWNSSLDVCDPAPRIYPFVVLFRSFGHA